MRDVTDSDKSPLSQKIKEVIRYLVQFLRHPIQEIARLPDWSWQRLLWVQISCAVASGVLASLLRPHFFAILAGIIVTPFIATLMVSVLTAFLYYYFQVFEKRTASAQKLFTLAVLSSLPFFILQIASSLIPPITLVGFAFSAMLIAVGLTENFQLEKRKAVRLAIGLFAVVMLVWLANKISLYRMDRSASQQASPLTQ